VSPVSLSAHQVAGSRGGLSVRPKGGDQKPAVSGGFRGALAVDAINQPEHGARRETPGAPGVASAALRSGQVVPMHPAPQQPKTLTTGAAGNGRATSGATPVTTGPARPPSPMTDLQTWVATAGHSAAAAMRPEGSAAYATPPGHRKADTDQHKRRGDPLAPAAPTGTRVEVQRSTGTLSVAAAGPGTPQAATFERREGVAFSSADSLLPATSDALTRPATHLPTGLVRTDLPPHIARQLADVVQ